MIVEWFKNLDYRLQYTIVIGNWSLFWLWSMAWLGNMEWCPGVEYSSDCAIRWLNATSVVSILIIWGCGIAALVIYHDHIRKNGDQL